MPLNVGPIDEKVESADTFNEKALEEGVVPPASSNGLVNRGGQTRSSIVSKQYDLDGDGKLDDIEKVMRTMDESNRGHLKNEKVYKILQEQLQAKQDLFNMKRFVMALTAFTVILVISNLGTAWAAATLAKDVTTQGNTLVNKNTDEIIHTRAEGVTYTTLIPGGDDAQRRLGPDPGSGGGCDYYTDNGSVSRSEAEDMFSDCRKGSVVNLDFACPYHSTICDGPYWEIFLCPSSTRHKSNQGGQTTWTYDLFGTDAVVTIGPCHATDETCPINVSSGFICPSPYEY